jgi:hypothetical protein
MKLLLPLLLAALPAFTATITYDNSLPRLFHNIEVSINGTVLSTDAGQIGVRINYVLPALMYCADPTTPLAAGPTLVDPISEADYANGGRLAWLYHAYNPYLTQGWEAAALQLAIWEVIQDNGADDLLAGLTRITANTENQVVNLANTMLQASAGQTATGLTFWVPDQGPPAVSQTLFRGVPSVIITTPEPANALLMGAGLLLLGAIRRRSRR